MVFHPNDPTNWFSRGGWDYAQFRPDYPLELVQFLALTVTKPRVVVDVGCGTGQLTVQLADYFERVIGIDPSPDQIANAFPNARVDYLCASAEQIPLPDCSVDLITAAQSAHWFDLLKFYAEARRVAAPGAVIALISYGVLQLPEVLQVRFNQFYSQEIGPFWPPERRMVDNGYRDLKFPFEELAVPRMELCREWDLNELIGYLSTWSAVRAAKDAGQVEMLTRFASDMTQLWGESSMKRAVSWPISMRTGTIEK